MSIDFRIVVEAFLGIVSIIGTVGSGFVVFYARTTARAIGQIGNQVEKHGEKLQTHETEIALLKLRLGLSEQKKTG